MQWDPTSYLRFGDERARPFFDLVARIRLDEPATVVDLGCGPGTLTESLALRWPTALVIGIDSSPEMIDAAQSLATDRLTFTAGDLASWTPDRRVDVVVSNAALQWVPEHRSLLPRLVDAVAPGGCLAFQVPGNFAAPSHVLLHELAADDRFAAYTAGLQRPAAAGGAEYVADLWALGLQVDAWETTYLHILPGPDAVFEWISGTGARPILQALPDDLRATFAAEYRARLRLAYPPQPFGTVLPFRRIFAVARKP